MLNLAAEDEGCWKKYPPRRRLKDPEDHLARERVLDPEECLGLLGSSPRWLQRIIVGAYEACLSQVDLLTLTPDEVHRKKVPAAMIKIMGGRNKTKARRRRQSWTRSRR